MARDQGLNVATDSAGTGDWHVGDPPYGPMIAAAKPRGWDFSDLRARQATADDFDKFDLIIAMDQSNRSNLEVIRPNGATTPVRLFLEYAGDCTVNDVPDPYYTRDFDGALDLIEAASKGLVASLR